MNRCERCGRPKRTTDDACPTCARYMFRPAQPGAARRKPDRNAAPLGALTDYPRGRARRRRDR